jgi:aspartyl-tRNA(Asn)/glutamyl-tRNA(Gln) amidotransferase subunit B
MGHRERTAHALPEDLRWAREARNRMRVSPRLDTQMDAPAQRIRRHYLGETGPWEVVIGMEVHAQVTSQSKLFSGGSTAFGGGPNAHVSLVDAAMPGMLPVINEECVKQAVRTGFWLNALPNSKSVFDRKNYFYPDLPQGYQISQYKSPIVGKGFVDVIGDDDVPFRVGIERLHLEQDAGKSLHDRHATTSFVDLNRSGVALMEIVSNPEIYWHTDAVHFIVRIRMLLQHLGTCDGDMERGNLRADVNVSVNRPGEPLGTRCEIKNLNSFHFISDAIQSEVSRQVRILEGGDTIAQETRLFDPDKGETRSMRSKEEAHDYRYFPDPDLLPLLLTTKFIDDLKANLPEHPDVRRMRYEKEYRLTVYSAGVLLNEKERTDHFEAMIDDGAEPTAAANWLINEYLGCLNRAKKTELPPMGWLQPWDTPILAPRYVPQTETVIPLGPVPPSANAAIIKMVSTGEISGKIAKDVLEYVFEHPDVDPRRYVQENNLQQVTDLSALEKLVDDIIAKNPDKVGDAKSNPKAIGWFVGQVMKASGGKANPQAVNDLLRLRLTA